MKLFVGQCGITREDKMEGHEKPFEDECGHTDHSDLHGGSEDSERWVDSRVIRRKWLDTHMWDTQEGGIKDKFIISGLRNWVDIVCDLLIHKQSRKSVCGKKGKWWVQF